MAKDVITRFKADVGNYDANIAKARRQLEGFKKDNLSAGGVIKQLSSNLVAASARFASVGGVIAGALKVAKDAFFNNEQQLDEWGKAVKSAQDLYSGFLTALNTGNINGYLQNINNIVSAARAAYDALDELNTYNAYNQINMGEASANLSEAMANFREGTGSKESVSQAAEAYKKELRDRMELEQQAYEAAVRDVAAKRGVNGDDLFAALTGKYGNYKSLKNLPLTGSKETIVGMGAYAKTATVAAPANDVERLGEALRQLNDTELKDLQALGAAAKQTAREVSNTDRTVARMLRGNTGGSGGGTSSGKAKKDEYIPLAGSIDEQIAKVKELQDAFNKTADQSVRGQLITAIDEATRHLEFMQGKGVEPLSANTGSLSSHLGLPDVSGLKITDEDIEKLNKIANAGQAAETSWDSAMGAVSGLGSALAAIEDPAVKVLGIIAEAIATVALSFAKALSKDTKLGVWGWIAAAAAGTAAMVTTISAIKSATAGSYEQGGIVPGNSYTGDRLTANVNSGELILSMAQSDRIANLLRNGNSMQNMHLTATIKGTDIQLALNNTARQQGRGTYVTAR